MQHSLCFFIHISNFSANKLDANVRVENREFPLVDVRDLANGMLLLLENDKAKGRYICSSFGLSIRALVEKLQSLFPDYKYPTRCTFMFSSSSLCTHCFTFVTKNYLR